MNTEEVALLVARQKQRMAERKLLISGEKRVLDPINNNTSQPVGVSRREFVEKRPLFEVKLEKEKSKDPYHRSIVLLYLVTSRMRGKMRRGEAILDKWNHRYPGRQPPGFYKETDCHLVDDLLTEVVNWIPAVVSVVKPSQCVDEDSSEESESAHSEFFIPYRYRISRWFTSLQDSITACRPGDVILVDTDITVDSTITCTSKPVRLISKSCTKKPVISSWLSGQYPLFSLGEGSSLEASNLCFRSNNIAIQSMDSDTVTLTNCDIMGGLLHGGIKDRERCGEWKLHKVQILSERTKGTSCYGLYLGLGARAVVTNSVISSHVTAVKLCGGSVKISDTRISGNGTGGGVVVGRSSAADLQRVDFSNNGAASVQIYSTSHTTSICDSSFSGEYSCCRLLMDIPPSSGGSSSLSVLDEDPPCRISLSRNELRASGTAPCLQLAGGTAACPQLSNADAIRIVASQNVFYSEERAIVNRMTLPSKMELLDNTFEQPSSVAILSTYPGTTLSINNRFTLRE